MHETQYYTNQGQVMCQVCKKPLQVIGGTHLKKHQMTMDDYKTKYPEAPLSAKSFGARAKLKSLKGFAGHNVENDVFQEDEIKNIPESKKIRLMVSKVEQVSDKVKKSKKDLPPILKNKVDIVTFLKTMYSSIVTNYFIEKKNLSGLLEYSVITDIVDLTSKTNFEFPNAFWHNRDARYDRYRDKKLEQDGWTVIRINEQYPTTDTLKKHMDVVF